jgi:PAS domain S-box-containing protein
MGDRSKFFRALARLYQMEATGALGFLCEQAPPELDDPTTAPQYHTITLDPFLASDTMLVAVDPQGTILHANDAAAFFAGRPPEALVGRDVFETFHDSEGLWERRMLIQCLETRCRVCCQKPSRFGLGTVNVLAFPVPDRCGRVACVIALIRPERHFVKEPELEGVRIVD